MQYIIIDFEWNNVYGRKINGFINEIIEIGAVKLDENLNAVDTYSQIVKSQIGKRLRGSVKELTHITNDDIKNGEPFEKAFAAFRKWIGAQESVILTWGDGDIRVLIGNYKYLNGISYIPFLTHFVDLQAYVQKKLELPKSQQVGLSRAAELLGVDNDSFAMHRALDDSLVSADCLRRCFVESEFREFIRVCNAAFYAKLAFKPHAISNINNPMVDKSELFYVCERCGKAAARQSDWTYSNQFFRAIYYCPVCKTKTKVGVRFKRLYDKIEVKHIASPYVEPEEKADNV